MGNHFRDAGLLDSTNTVYASFRHLSNGPLFLSQSIDVLVVVLNVSSVAIVFDCIATFGLVSIPFDVR